MSMGRAIIRTPTRVQPSPYPIGSAQDPFPQEEKLPLWSRAIWGKDSKRKHSPTTPGREELQSQPTTIQTLQPTPDLCLVGRLQGIPDYSTVHNCNELKPTPNPTQTKANHCCTETRKSSSDVATHMSRRDDYFATYKGNKREFVKQKGQRPLL